MNKMVARGRRESGLHPAPGREPAGLGAVLTLTLVSLMSVHKTSKKENRGSSYKYTTHKFVHEMHKAAIYIQYRLLLCLTSRPLMTHVHVEL